MYTHPISLSPDPGYGRDTTPDVLFPWRLVRSSAPRREWIAWADRLNLFNDAGPLSLSPDAAGTVDLVLDFGTELEAELEMELSGAAGPVYVSFGESLPEAETWGVPTTHPHQTVEWVPDANPAQHRFEARGFRYIRIQAHDLPAPLRLGRIAARVFLPFAERPGDLLCDDARFQRAWQTSVYTARLCSRTDTYWDGIKRDRVGWFGDARIIQETTDAVFADPRPALGMLNRLPTDQWVTGIPGFSLDAIAMFRQILLFHGPRPAGREAIWKRIKALLAWIEKKQINRDGFIVRDPEASFFGDIAFLDWSRMPIGGRFEELSWLQCRLLEGWRRAAEIAEWLGDAPAHKHYGQCADRLATNLRKRFWDARTGLTHTLNQTVKAWRHLRVLDSVGGAGYRQDWAKTKGFGPSGPSRHSMAWAVWSGLLDTPDERRLALNTFNSNRLPALVTAYFLYYEQCARAECGEADAAVRTMRDFVGRQIEENDSATVWEWYQPGLTDLRKYCLGDWPKSLCHGWASGLTPMTLRYVVGLRPVEPGFARIQFGPLGGGPSAFQLRHPTPRGMLIASREGEGQPVVVKCPARIKWDGTPPAGLRLETVRD